MLQTFKDRLKAKYGKLNLTEKRINSIAEKLNKRFPELADDAAHDTAIEGVYDEADLTEIAKLDEILNKPAPEPKKEEPKKEEKKDEPKDDMPAWFKSYKEENDKRFAELNVEKSKATIQSKLKDKLKDVPEKFWSKRVQPENEDGIDTFATEVVSDYAEIVPKPTGYQPGKATGGRDNKPNEKFLNNMVDELMGVQSEENKN